MGTKCNAEGYSDPVPYEAIRAIEREERKRHYRPLVYICSPYAGEVERNTMKAKEYCRFAVDNGVIPIAPHLLFPQFMEEATERELAMLMNMVLLGRCRELWVFGSHISEGMAAEIRRAKQKHMSIRYFKEE
ncbi:DUF7768 domain-containing protein [Anaerocolumna sp. MB42-C2]|uniref:DUF7768 domain-containing protein n=1 Tax=Anaerocolumna sp. MB42-C2 TaxID=3070997 RepID=UPI0027E07017|nr:DUF4406 domain-containing protein [Anaerocolumna sp. MB42-C2]WMJ87766.1 DUF4406 domain-containing protein [Anaerocolumna sp. MB42-C2]